MPTETTVKSAVPTVEPLRRLRDLHREGALGAEFPLVCRLVAELAPDDLPRAGRLLRDLDAGAVRREHAGIPTLKIALTGHGTLAPLEPLLAAETARHGLLAQITTGLFDGYVAELADPDSGLRAGRPDLTLCLLDPMVVFDEVSSPWRPEHVAASLDAKIGMLAGLAGRFGADGAGTLVLNTLPLPRRFPAQLVDLRSRARLGALWREANARLLRLAEEHPTLVVLDIDPLVAEGSPATDPRLSTYTRTHLSPALMAAYARETGHLARHLAGRTKKVLALDLDGTIWGGVLGEDGADGIEVGDGYRGEAFTAFQHVIRQLSAQGVLVAVVSKNEPDAVRAVLRDHPRMTLREGDLVRTIANWRPKHDNLTELASALNLSADSFVFVDDSSYECGLVRHALPGVAVVPVGTEPALHITDLLGDGWFDCRELTAEDQARVRSYQAEQARGDFLESSPSLEDYLHGLGLRVRIGPVAEPDVPRLSQLTLRTNQFHLTTRRLQPAQVRDLAADDAWQVLSIHVADRFGDGGVVGAVFTRRDDDVLHLENFLLSCRVFSRGVEHACLSAVLSHARSTGARAVYGRYVKTAKNTIVADFYPRYGFVLDTEDETGAVHRHDLADVAPPPEHIELTAHLGGVPA